MTLHKIKLLLNKCILSYFYMHFLVFNFMIKTNVKICKCTKTKHTHYKNNNQKSWLTLCFNF